jgi:hypothetical protein
MPEVHLPKGVWRFKSSRPSLVLRGSVDIQYLLGSVSQRGLMERLSVVIKNLPDMHQAVGTGPRSKRQPLPGRGSD